MTTLGYCAEMLTPKELADAIANLDALPPIERARQARSLSDAAKTVLSRVGDAAVVEAVAGAPYAEVARRLDVSESAVNKAVSRHKARAREISP